MISIVYDVQTYRRLLVDTIQTSDKVIEIGPHRGLSTIGYVDKTEKTIIVEKGLDAVTHLTKFAQENKKIYPVFGDARDFSTMQLVLKQLRLCDVFAIDMGGGRYPDTVFKVWSTWAAVFKPRDSIIRCRGLAEFIKKAKIVDETIDIEFEQSGYLNEYGRPTPEQIKKNLDEFEFYLEPTD